ncbi:MAG: DUF2314 domain-containing protein [Phycisphaerae bacterium]|nr:DUF2314 domain-containing protein [Phycisphaerae bacterium]
MGQKRKIVNVDAEDKAMNAAIAEAKRTLPTFLRAWERPKPNQESFLLKVEFFGDDDEATPEHIWIADLAYEGDDLVGTVANEPQTPGLSYLQRVTIEDLECVTDWMYIENGRLVGGFTTRAIRNRLSPKERAAFEKAVPYRFD